MGARQSPSEWVSFSLKCSNLSSTLVFFFPVISNQCLTSLKGIKSETGVTWKINLLQFYKSCNADLSASDSWTHSNPKLVKPIVPELKFRSMDCQTKWKGIPFWRNAFPQVGRKLFPPRIQSSTWWCNNTVRVLRIKLSAELQKVRLIDAVLSEWIFFTISERYRSTEFLSQNQSLPAHWKSWRWKHQNIKFLRGFKYFMDVRFWRAEKLIR